ncbi:pleiotropic drug resistance protein [Klebsormidium nitens]|uniref:Pleiotropic drug resistance protein n=1 Tax=Klebsormidium nitens TaxID=105231 RepID=A0A1Y1HQC7_KLENI|nr:pleiotropic drug resistance protein [Klebsormidium nitens]|eukprot:GAQ78767.1 pleiotropic drug resistance protein [Klebsormidium nitens]
MAFAAPGGGAAVFERGRGPGFTFSMQPSGLSNNAEDTADLELAALQIQNTLVRTRHATVPIDERLEAYVRQGSKLGTIDISHLKPEEQKVVVEKALQTTDQDNELFLRKLRERAARVGIAPPTIEVRYEDLCIDADVYVGSRALPTLTNASLNLVEDVAVQTGVLKNKKRDFAVLKNVSGVLKPERMTLLLGPPGSGKTTLMLALAGKLSRDLRMRGKISYNGRELHEFVPQRTAAYISQVDTHTPEMTVRETFDFAARMQGPGYRSGLLKELTKRELEKKIMPDPDIDAFIKAASLENKQQSVSTEYILRTLGLDVCADTIVGGEMARGISGGQKKRVTTGEMIVGPKQALFMDEISTGLDSSTTFQIVKCMRNWAHYAKGTCLMALLQPAPETFELFDDILLLSEGCVVYHGPVGEVLAFFEAQGFKCPERKGAADFLQEVTSQKDQQQYWSRDGPYRYVPVSVFAEAFKQSKHGEAIAQELSVPFDAAKDHPMALVKEKYALSTWAMLRGSFRRELLLMQRNMFLYQFRATQTAIMAFVSATVFFRTTLGVDVDHAGMYLAFIFFGLTYMLFSGFSEMAITVGRLPVFYKQRDNLFLTGFALNMPTCLLRIPFSLLESFIWTIISYYVVGLAPQADRFFSFWLLLFLVHSMAMSLFRLIGALGRSMVMANTFGSFALMVIFLLGGFILAKPKIHPWWVWGYWVSPLSYAQNALAANEYTAPRWNDPYPVSPIVLFGHEQTNLTVGDQLLLSRGLHTPRWWVWIGVGTMIGYYVIFNLICNLALDYSSSLDKVSANMPEEELKAKEAAVTGGVLPPADAPPGNGTAKPQQKTIPEGDIEMGSVEGERAQAAAAADVMPPAKKSPSMRNSLSLRKRPSLQQRASYIEPIAEKGMILPFQPLALTFDNMWYSVDMPKGIDAGGETKLKLLKGISGSFRPGVLTALMGVSGAGKTTLMDVLAGRKTGGYIDGDIRVGGFPKDQKTFARVSGYVEQTDIHSPQTTVREALQYSAWLRLPQDVDPATREEFVNQVMDLVELTGIRNALVGLPGSTGLSVEQRKRLTIAVELVANPSIIFMDEPTSGLDARAAAIVMRAVRNTVNTGRTVVCTIHQPSIDIFESFDELLLLKRGGRTIYAGPLGEHSRELIAYFKQYNGVRDIKPQYNPATWMLENTTPFVEEGLGKDFADLYAESDRFKSQEALIKELSVPAPGTQPLAFAAQYSQSMPTQFLAVLWKFNITYWRTPEYNAVRFFFCIMVGIIFGTIFWDLGLQRHTTGDLLNVCGGLYATVLFLGVSNASTVQPVVAVERSVFYRERAAGMYSAIPYTLAQGAIEFPYVIVQSIIYSLITYSLIHFEWTAVKFFWYVLFMFLTLMLFTFYGMMAVAITPNVQLAAVLSSSMYSVWNLFCGFLITQPNIPGWWVWMYYLDPVSWTLYGLVGSQLGDVTEGPFPFTQGAPPQTVQEFVHSYFGYKHSFLGWAAFILIVMIAVFWAIVIYATKKFNFQSR